MATPAPSTGHRGEVMPVESIEGKNEFLRLAPGSYNLVTGDVPNVEAEYKAGSFLCTQANMGRALTLDVSGALSAQMDVGDFKAQSLLIYSDSENTTLTLQVPSAASFVAAGAKIGDTFKCRVAFDKGTGSSTITFDASGAGTEEMWGVATHTAQPPAAGANNTYVFEVTYMLIHNAPNIGACVMVLGGWSGA